MELVEDEDLGFGRAWVHRLGRHVDFDEVDRALSKSATQKRAEMVKKLLQTAQDLLAALESMRNDKVVRKVCEAIKERGEVDPSLLEPLMDLDVHPQARMCS